MLMYLLLFKSAVVGICDRTQPISEITAAGIEPLHSPEKTERRRQIVDSGGKPSMRRPSLDVDGMHSHSDQAAIGWAVGPTPITAPVVISTIRPRSAPVMSR